MFAGIIALAGFDLDRRARERVIGATGGSRTKVDTSRLPGAFFANGATPSVADRAESPRVLICEGDALFVADARLDNRDELGAELGLTAAAVGRASDAEIVLLVLRRWGDAGVARILGAFAFALWEAQARRLTMGRDCLGQRALFFHAGKNTVAFATTLNALFALTGGAREIDEVALARFMVVDLSEARRTFYRGIERVPSRTLISFDGAGIRARHYWSPDPNAAQGCKTEDDYVDRAQELLDQAVVSATRGNSRLAIAMSGGLDSSALAATASRLNIASTISCYVSVPPEDCQMPLPNHRYASERDKVEALLRMYPKLDVRYISMGSIHPVDEDPALYFAQTGLPMFGPAGFAWVAEIHRQIFADGHRSALSGGFGNFALSWGGDYSLIELLNRGRLSAFAHELIASSRYERQSVARLLMRDVLTPVAPTALRHAIHRIRKRDPYDVMRYSALNPSFIAEGNLQSAWKTGGFDPWFGMHGSSGARIRAFWLFDAHQVGRDTRAMWPDIHRTEHRAPHADRRLAEFAISVPEPMFRQNGVPRSFARRVLADRLPPEILNERRRGAQATTWFRALTARREQITHEIEHIEASPTARRMLDIPRLKRLLEKWPKDENIAQSRLVDYKIALTRGVHIGKFIRWVEGANA